MSLSTRNLRRHASTALPLLMMLASPQAHAAREEWVPSVIPGQNAGVFQPRPDERFRYLRNPNLGNAHLTVPERFNNFTGRWHQVRRDIHVVFGIDAERGPASTHPRYYYYPHYHGQDRWGYAGGEHEAMRFMTEHEFEDRFGADELQTLELAWRDYTNSIRRNTGDDDSGHDEL